MWSGAALCHGQVTQDRATKETRGAESPLSNRLYSPPTHGRARALTYPLAGIHGWAWDWARQGAGSVTVSVTWRRG